MTFNPNVLLFLDKFLDELILSKAFFHCRACQLDHKADLLIFSLTGNGFIVFPFHVCWPLKTIEIKETAGN